MADFSGQQVFGEQIIGQTDGTFTSTEEFLQDAAASADLVIDGNEDSRFHVQFEVDFNTTPGSDAIFSFYSTTDDSPNEEWDVSPFYQIQISRNDDPARKSTIIAGYYRWKIGVKADGSDTITSAAVKIRGVSYK